LKACSLSDEQLRGGRPCLKKREARKIKRWEELKRKSVHLSAWLKERGGSRKMGVYEDKGILGRRERFDEGVINPRGKSTLSKLCKRSDQESLVGTRGFCTSRASRSDPRPLTEQADRRGLKKKGFGKPSAPDAANEKD